MDRREVVQHLLEACPSFETDVDSCTGALSGDTTDFYACLAALATHIVELARSDRDDELEAALRGVESAYEQSDESMRWKVTYGLLQDVCDRRAKEALDPRQIEAFLGQITSEFWGGLQSWWDVVFVGQNLVFDGSTWLEVDADGPEREIEVDGKGVPTYAAPSILNRGRILDVDWTPEEFRKQIASRSNRISEDLFEAKWSEYFRLRSDDSPLEPIPPASTGWKPPDDLLRKS